MNEELTNVATNNVPESKPLDELKTFDEPGTADESPQNDFEQKRWTFAFNAALLFQFHIGILFYSIRSWRNAYLFFHTDFYDPRDDNLFLFFLTLELLGVALLVVEYGIVRLLVRYKSCRSALVFLCYLNGIPLLFYAFTLYFGAVFWRLLIPTLVYIWLWNQPNSPRRSPEALLVLVRFFAELFRLKKWRSQ